MCLSLKVGEIKVSFCSRLALGITRNQVCITRINVKNNLHTQGRINISLILKIYVQVLLLYDLWSSGFPYWGTYSYCCLLEQIHEV